MRRTELDESAKTIADILNNGLAKTGIMRPPAWVEIQTILSKARTITSKNAIMRRVAKAISPEIKTLVFMANGSKLVIADRACAEERIVFVMNDLVWDFIADIWGLTLREYTKIVLATNVSVYINEERSTYITAKATGNGYNKRQWKLLTNHGTPVTVNKVVAANTKWHYDVETFMCKYCGTVITCNAKYSKKLHCAYCSSTKLMKLK